MKSATATASLLTDLAAAGKAPEWVQLFPAGPEIIARDGRSWIADPEAVLASFDAHQGPLAIDYEHAQDLLEGTGQEAPAAGWIVKVENRDGAVWGQVEWTERAALKIVSREYRFLSPAFLSDASSKITGLIGAGLVNRPALRMQSLARKQTMENDAMNKIALALGLAAAATETAILARLQADSDGRAEICKALSLDPAQADGAAVLAAIAQLKDSAADKTELAALKTSLETATTQLAALQKKDADREIDAALDAAAAEGKITPASRDTYRAMCAVEGGLEKFKALAATLPVVCAPSRLDDKTIPPAAAGDEKSPTELASLARKYIDEQAAIGRTVSMTAAVAHVKETK